MNITDYAKHINKLAEEFPDAKVVYAQDEEGNSFHPVAYDPSAGKYKDREFTPRDSEDFGKKGKVNAICIN